MTWLAGQTWVLLLLSALVGFALTWWWMVRKVRGRVPLTTAASSGAAVAADAGAASAASAASAAGAAGAASAAMAEPGITGGATALAGSAAAPQLTTGQAPDDDGVTVDGATPPADIDGDIDAPEADADLPTVDVPDVAVPDPGVPDMDLTDVEPVVPLADTGADAVIDSDAEVDAEAVGLVGGTAATSYAVGSFGDGSVDRLPDGSMPVGYDVKGNADSMLYHSPESPWYARTKAEVWFRDEATAAAAGFARWDSRGRGSRGDAGDGAAAAFAAPSYAVGSFGEGSVDPLPDGSMPVGFEVKGNADSMLYHSPESPWYPRTKAEVWFRDEATAAAAGFKHWNPAKR